MASPPPKTERVSPQTIQNAVNALLKWKTTQSTSQKPQLLPQEDYFYLIITLKKIPKTNRTNPYKIPLPHPLLQDSLSPEICLIIDDRPKSGLSSGSAKAKVRSDNILVSKVLKFSKLKTDYKPFEAKRKLCDSYDMFFADKRVIPLLPKLLGKQFFKKKKLPLPVDLSHKNWKEQIERGCGSALLRFKSGTCSVVRVGLGSMEGEEVVENVVEAINGVVEFVPKKWEGVRSLHLKFGDSLALPVYQTVPDLKLKIKGVSEDVEEGAEEDGGSEVEVKEGKKKEGKSGKKENRKKKGRIHEVRYMDVVNVGDGEVGSDVDEDEDEMIKDDDDDDLVVGKKRKKGASSEVDVEKPRKKTVKKGKTGRDDADVENGDGENENDDLGSDEIEVKKKSKKGDSTKGKVVDEKSEDKRQKKVSKKEESEELKKSLSAVEESDGKKGKRKSALGKTVKSSTDKKAKSRKKSAD